MPANETVQKYYDALIASYDILVDAVAKSNERGLKVTQQLVSDVAKGQRDALELGKKLAAEPTDLGQFYTAVLEATTAAQGRALAFTQAAYQEAAGASTDTREAVQKLIAANQETTKAAVEVARKLATANPLADVMRRNVERFTAAAAPKAAAPKAPKAEKATV